MNTKKKKTPNQTGVFYARSEEETLVKEYEVIIIK